MHALVVEASAAGELLGTAELVRAPMSGSERDADPQGLRALTELLVGSWIGAQRVAEGVEADPAGLLHAGWRVILMALCPAPEPRDSEALVASLADGLRTDPGAMVAALVNDGVNGGVNGARTAAWAAAVGGRPAREVLVPAVWVTESPAMKTASTDEHVELLRRNGLRATGQRLVILAALERLGHATMEQLLEATQAELPNLQLSTVYRSVETLTAHSIVSHTHLTGPTPTPAHDARRPRAPGLPRLRDGDPDGRRGRPALHRRHRPGARLRRRLRAPVGVRPLRRVCRPGPR